MFIYEVVLIVSDVCMKCGYSMRADALILLCAFYSSSDGSFIDK